MMRWDIWISYEVRRLRGHELLAAFVFGDFRWKLGKAIHVFSAGARGWFEIGNGEHAALEAVAQNARHDKGCSVQI